MRNTGHGHAGLRRRVGADAKRRSTRRALLVTLAASASGFPFFSLAQRPAKLKRIGILAVAEESFLLPQIAAFNQAMRELGYVEGKDYAIELRSARGDVKRLPPLAAELVALGVDVIIPTGTPNTIAARDATRTVPIVMVTTSDPVASGLIASLARPGGNITGFISLTSEMAMKRLELLREIAPSLRRVGFLHNPDSVADRSELKLLAAGADKLKVQVISAGIPFGQDVAATFAMLKREKAEAVIVTSGANLTRRAAIIEQAYKNRLPSIYGNSAFVEDGGLLGFATDWPDQYRRAATYVDKIFKGAKPGDLPVEQPTKFELMINMKTAKALGIKIPQSILVRADKVIE